MVLELPRLGFAAGAALALCLLCALVTAAVVGRYPAAPGGAAGLVSGLAMALWLYVATLRPARALRKLTWLPDGGWRLEFQNGRVTSAHLGAATRVLGRSVVLQWRAEDRSLLHWLTPWDVEDAQLRAVAVRLNCAASLRGS